MCNVDIKGLTDPQSPVEDKEALFCALPCARTGERGDPTQPHPAL
jgi:hypothetical protein